MAFKMKGITPFKDHEKDDDGNIIKHKEEKKSFGKPKIIGETKSAWMARSFGNPGFAEDKRVWDGKKWV